MKKLFTIITIIGLLTAILPGAAFADEATVTLSQERMDEITRYLDEDEVLDMQTAVRVNEYLNICEKINAEEGTQWGFMTEEDRETINEKYGLDVPSPSEITITPEEFEADLRQVVAREKVINAQAAIYASSLEGESQSVDYMQPDAIIYHSEHAISTQNGLNGQVWGTVYDNGNPSLFWDSIDRGDCSSTPEAVADDPQRLCFLSNEISFNKNNDLADGGRTAYVDFIGRLLYPDGE